jgi:hypothetical protein
MTPVAPRPTRRKRPPLNRRVRFVTTIGCPARRRWLKPYVVRIFKVERGILWVDLDRWATAHIGPAQLSTSQTSGEAHSEAGLMACSSMKGTINGQT